MEFVYETGLACFGERTRAWRPIWKCDPGNWVHSDQPKVLRRSRVLIAEPCACPGCLVRKVQAQTCLPTLRSPTFQERSRLAEVINETLANTPCTQEAAASCVCTD